MSGIPWQDRAGRPTVSQLPWRRPPRARGARHLVLAAAAAQARGFSILPTVSPAQIVVPAPAHPRVATVVLRSPVRPTWPTEVSHLKRSAAPAGAANAGLPSASRRVEDTRAPTLSARLLAVLQPPLELSLSRSGPLEWPADLMDYQLAGIRTLLSSDRILLADEMGLGKTIQTIAAVRLLMRTQRLSSCLIVVPAAVLTQWLDQLDRWSPELRTCVVRGPAGERPPQWRMPAHVHVVSYETLRSDAHLSRERTWDLVVIDEAQKIKNAESDVSAVVKRLLRRRAWALTGTPLENRIDDLASILEFVAPRLPDQPPHRVASGVDLRDELAAVQLRRRKQDVLRQLPPKTLSDLLLDMTTEQRRSYTRAENEGLVYLRELGTSVTVANVLELIMRLKQLCNFDPETGASAKLADLDERLDALVESGQRALVFSQFADATFGAEAIAQRLGRYRPVVYTGGMALAERDAAIRTFVNDFSHHVMVLSLRAGGQGLNLQAASYVFHFDRWWNPAVEDQATDRSHRLGQALPVHVYSYTTQDSIEERIRDILRDKRELFERIVEGVGIDVRDFSSDELFRIIGLAAPPPSDADEDPLGFEREVAARLERAGYFVELTPRSHDGGIDLVATKVEAGGLARSQLWVQCKLSSRPSGVDAVRELIGSLPPAPAGVTGVLVARAGFTAEAAAWARVRGIELWGPEELRRLGK